MRYIVERYRSGEMTSADIYALWVKQRVVFDGLIGRLSYQRRIIAADTSSKEVRKRY